MSSNRILFKSKKILIINVFGIGDVLFTTPFISNLKAAYPDLSIAYLGNKRTMPLLKSYAKIDKVFTYERDEFLKVYSHSKLEFFKLLRNFLREIKKEGFDAVFDFSLNTPINFLTWFVGIKERIGLNYKNRSPWLTRKFPFKGFEEKHVAEYYLAVLAQLGVPVTTQSLEISIDKNDDAGARNFLDQYHLGRAQPLIGVIPGAGASWGPGAKYRRWSCEKYAKLVDKLIENFKAKIILMGDQSEEKLCSAVSRKFSSEIIPAFGKTTIGQLTALLARCHLVVLNDGGPLHLAVAAGTKTVSIFGPVDERVYGPYGDLSKHLTVSASISCRPCYRRFRMTSCEHISCLEWIDVEDVLQKVKELL